MPSERFQWLRLTLLGLVGGALAAAMVLGFRVILDLGQELVLPSGVPGDFESIGPIWRILMPVGAGLALGWVFDRLPAEHRQVGIVHVLRRMQTPGGKRLPLQNLLVQLGGAVIAIVFGHSVDREGPAVHIGAGGASQLSRGHGFTEEDSYTLTGCGAAAAIAAVFNTPLAAVIFVIEVLRFRYAVTRILPVIAASVVGAVASRLCGHADPMFAHHSLTLQNQWELPLLVLLGITAGIVAVGFIELVEWVAAGTRTWPNRLAFTCAGLCTGVLALATPQIMGVSADTLEQLLHAEGGIGISLALALVFTKGIASAVSVGLRVPGGLIGPTLFIGGALGSVLGLVLGQVESFDSSSPGFYANVGMVAMMGATLRAPLAALTALLELTGNPNIILPGMLAVTSAELTNRLFLGKESVFDALLKIHSRSMRDGGR